MHQQRPSPYHGNIVGAYVAQLLRGGGPSGGNCRGHGHGRAAPAGEEATAAAAAVAPATLGGTRQLQQRLGAVIPSRGGAASGAGSRTRCAGCAAGACASLSAPTIAEDGTGGLRERKLVSSEATLRQLAARPGIRV
jgi:hypothetical protein